ncbi:MAG TPA: PASTA domain-containing protein [Solirubrobacteraceae bacterium]
MNDRTAVQPRRTQRAKSTRRGGPAGRQVVGEYVGQPAGDAAQAVRRAGLCPGLDRSFGCEAELIGLVVAQEPAAGSDLARNGMVTLYVAAPGAGPMDEEPAATEAVDEAPVTVTAVLAEIEPPDAASRPRRARRRKPGLARQATGVFDPPPAPIALESEPAEEVPLAPECGFPDGEELDEGRLEEQSDAELLQDDFVVHLDDVLGGRSEGPPAWRRVYPRRRTFAALTSVGGIRVWLGEHSLLAKAVGAALAVWILVGLASALDSQHAGTPTASLASPSHRPARTRTTQARPPVSAPSVASARPTVRSPQVRRAARHSEAPHLDRERAPVIGAAAHPERMAVQAPAAAPPAPPASASASAAPPAQQTQGGLFSP